MHRSQRCVPGKADHTYVGRGIYFCFFFFFWIFFVFRGFWLLASVASGFCGFWLLWLLAFVAFGFRGFRGFWLFGLSIYLSIPIYLSSYPFFLSFFLLAAVLLSLFVFAFPVVSLQRRNQTRKQASKHELLTFGSGVLLGGALRPPQPPPRHEICTSSPTPAPATKSICLGELPGAKLSNQANMPPLSIYLSIYLI